MEMKRWSGYDKYVVLAERSGSRGLQTGFAAYLAFKKVLEAINMIANKKGDSYKYEGELYSKLITSSKAFSILKGLEECRYSSDIKRIAIQIKATECLG
jgi:hypothetical protein|tara:strand:+ start:2773 stop:3069 length:297 start_codon:yes stop_codon:yes gene_type:complete